MKYQIDFLPIGTKTCGDSFALRFGYLDSDNPADQTVILIDGGFTDDATLIKEHFDNWYGHNKIDLVVSTHPDQDHINGLPGVLENMNVGQLWMHLPWEHSDVLSESKDGNFNVQRLNEKLAKSLRGASNLASIASQKGILVEEPFAGETSFETVHGKITVVGPSRDYYESLLPQFLDWQPKTKTQLSAIEKILKGIQKAAETFNIETLRDKGETSPQNNSSAMILIEFNNKKFLFTGDAGRDAIDLACEELEFLGHKPGTYTVVQVPHHGSRHNVGPSVLDKLLGAKLSSDIAQRGHAYVSAAKDCEDHPKKLVLNAFRRRGYPVISTEGISRVISNGGPDRGWTTSIPHPLYAEVEDDD
jgi:beta-lactamase superfamily II metal-dependent hydrolase